MLWKIEYSDKLSRKLPAKNSPHLCNACNPSGHVMDSISTPCTQAKKAGDTNVYFIDGKRYYGKNRRDLYAVDGCHPTDLGFYKMAKTVYPVLKKILNH